MIARGFSVVLLLLASSPAWACPVCGGGGRNAQAFVDTMLFMTAVPLLMLGGGAAFLWWRHRQLQDASRLDPDVRIVHLPDSVDPR